MPLEKIRLVYGDTAGNIKIQKKSGEAHRLLDVYIDASGFGRGSYMDVIVETTGITRIPLKTQEFELIEKPENCLKNGSIFALIREWFGEDVFVEADEDEDILLKVRASDGSAIDISKISVAVYEVIPTPIDKTLLLRSGCEHHVIAPYIYGDESVTGGANYDKVTDLDKCIQMDGLPEITDGHMVPSGVEYELKALVTDRQITETTAEITVDSNAIHIKDRTFELFTPITLKGIDLTEEEGVAPRRNIGAINLATGRYLSGQNYVFRSGHEIGLTMYWKITGDGVDSAATFENIVIPIMLMRKL